jgi:hypothetical protein
MEIKVCECGCGNPAPIPKLTVRRRGWVKGQPLRFIKGHNFRQIHSLNENNVAWKGGRHLKEGRPYVLNPKRTMGERMYVLESRLFVERLLKLVLPKEAVIHHVDGNPCNNAASNLVICQDRAYHLFLHQRMRAYRACGHAGWRKCKYCKQYDDPKNLFVARRGVYHRDCVNKYNRSRYIAKLRNEEV